MIKTCGQLQEKSTSTPPPSQFAGILQGKLRQRGFHSRILRGVAGEGNRPIRRGRCCTCRGDTPEGQRAVSRTAPHASPCSRTGGRRAPRAGAPAAEWVVVLPRARRRTLGPWSPKLVGPGGPCRRMGGVWTLEEPRRTAFSPHGKWRLLRDLDHACPEGLTVHGELSWPSYLHWSNHGDLLRFSS